MKNDNDDLAEMRRILAEGGTIPFALLLRCMRSEDIETLGIAMHVICSRYSRLDSPIEPATIWSFARHYFERCLLENPRGEFAESRYQAGDTLVHWFKGLWEDDYVPREILAELKQMLATLYRRGDGKLREAIVNASLEHLFEDPAIVEYFHDWKDDPILSEAYDLALEWGKDHWASAPSSG